MEDRTLHEPVNPCSDTSCSNDAFAALRENFSADCEVAIQSRGSLTSLSEWLDGRGLVGAHVSSGNGCGEKVLATGRRAGEAALHGKLADMGEGVGDGSLEERFGGCVQWGVGDEVVVECLQCGEEASSFLGPRERGGVVARRMPQVPAVRTERGVSILWGGQDQQPRRHQLHKSPTRA